MRPPTFLFVALLLLMPLAHAAAQQPFGVLVPVGARVKAEAAGKTIEGTLLSRSGDTLVLRAQEPAEMRGDTVRLAGASLRRVMESPALWRYTAPTDINFHAYAVVPGAGDMGHAAAEGSGHLLLVASDSELAGVDPEAGTAIWTRRDLPDLEPVALVIVGSTGYGVITRGERMEILDLRTGETRWDTGALSLLSARGWLPLPGPDRLILMYGSTAQSASTLLAVELATGKVRWRQEGLFALEPKVFDTGGISYLLGHQPPLGDTDTTLVLYISTEGPIRLDGRTGALLWRSDVLRGAKIPAVRDRYPRILRYGGVLVVPSQTRLLGLKATDGRAAWTAPRVFANHVVRMERTRHGLLVRGDDWLDLLEPATGRSVWRMSVPLKKSTRMSLRGDTVYVVADKNLLAIQVPDGSVRTLTTVRFDDGEMPSGFGVLEEGIVVNSWHHVVLLDRQGSERYRRSYPSPGESFGEALGRAGGVADTRRPSTRWHGLHLYFFTGAADEAGHEGFSLVKFDPAKGREEGRIWFDKRAPGYIMESASGVVYHTRGAREIAALTFGDWAALAHAARTGRTAVVERLLEMGVDPKAAGDGGWTALHLAARSGHPEVVRLLLARGADLQAMTKGGWSAWMVAEGQGHTTVAQLLRDAGAQYDTATAALLRGWHLSRQGRISEALAAYAEAQAVDSALAVAPSAWMALCWNGSLSGHAAEVMAACERAVERTAPSDQRYASVRFARGLARALTGDLAGAAADLEPSLDPEPAEEDGDPVQEWIDALREGRNPFTPAVLESLSRR